MFQKKQSDLLRHDDFVEDGAIRDYFGAELVELITKTIPKAKATIIDFAKATSAELKGITLEKIDLNGLKKVAELKKQSNDLSLLNAKLAKAEAAANAELEKQRQQEIKTKKAQIDLDKKQQSETKKSKDAYGQLASELAKLKREAKNLGAQMIELEKAGKKNTAEYKALAVQYIIAKNNASSLDKQIKSLDSSVGDNQRRVGSYKDAIKEAANELGLFGANTQKAWSILKLWIGSLKTAKRATEEQTFATEAASVATTKWGKAFQFVGKGIKGLGLGVIIALLGSIAASFKTTEKGIVQFEAAMNSLGSIIRIFIGRLGKFGQGLLEFFPALFKDLRNGFFNLEQDMKEFFGLDAEAKRSTNNISEAMKKMSTAFDGVNDAVQKAIQLETELAILRRQNRRDNLQDQKVIRIYASEVEKLNQIADDQTLSFEKREEAANKALDFVKKSTEAEIRIKQRAVKEAKKQLQVRKLQNEDTLEAEEHLAEVLDQLDDAETKRDVLQLQGEQRRRLIRVKQLQNQVQLIEQTFDKEKELRDKHIADLEKDFSERQKLIDEGEQASKAKYEKEVTRVSEASDQIINANELITISDEEQLAARIKSLQLGDKAEDILLKAITNRKAEIKSAVDQARDLNKQILEDLKKQKQIEQDIKNEKVRSVEIAIAQELKDAGDNLVKQKEILDRSKKLKEQKLKDDAEFEKRKVKEDKTESPELQAKKILLIDEKLKNDLIQNENDYLNSLEAIHKKQKDEIFRTLNEITDGIARGLQERSDLQQQADQRDIDFHQRTLEIQAKLAAEGKDNILAEEQARIAKAEEKKLQDQKRAQKIQQNIAIIKTFADTLSKALDKNEPFLKAFAEATAASGLVEGFFEKLFAGGFAEGVENLKGKGTGTSDSNIALLSTGESVTTAQGTKETPGLVTAVNEKGYQGAVDWAFDNIYTPQFKASSISTTQQAAPMHDAQLASVFISKVDELRDEIRNKPVAVTNLGRLGEWTDEIQERGMKTIIHHKKYSHRSSMRKHGG